MGRFRLEQSMPTLTPQQVEDAARAMPDHTLATSFLEPDARARVIVLVLFAHEVARARSVVSEAGLAAIRLQWWRDTLDQIYSGQTVRAQPIAIALAGAILEANLPRRLLDAMIDGYERELQATPFATWGDLEGYLDATFGNLNRLSLLASGVSSISTSVDEVARQAALAWGLSHLLRATPNWLERRCLWLPEAACTNLDREAMFAGQVSGELRKLLGGTQKRIVVACTKANHALKGAQFASHFPPIAHACLSGAYAKAALPAVGTNWSLSPSITLLSRQIRITLSIARGRI